MEERESSDEQLGKESKGEPRSAAELAAVTDAHVERIRRQLEDFCPASPPPPASTTPNGRTDLEASVGKRLRALIARSTAREVVSFHARLIVLDSRDSLDTCLLTLQDNCITAVPIVDLEQRSFIGMISALDLAAYLASLFPNKEEAPEQLPNIELKSIISTALLFNEHEKGFTIIHTLSEDFSKMTPFLPQPLDTPLAALMKVFSDGLHRLPLKNEKGSICSLVTQSDVLRYFVAHLNELLGSDLRSSNALPSISALGLTPNERPLEKISAEVSVVEVIDHLYKVSAVALIDDEGKLIGDLSADSLRQLSVHNFKRLYQPARLMGDMVALAFRENAPLDEVIGTILDESKHRAWVVDHENKPIALITLTDIIRKLVSL